MSIQVYIPAHNCATDVRASLQGLEGWDVVVVDNASEPEQYAPLQQFPGIRLQRHERNLGRLGNWAFCVRHFLEGGATWLKWLFAGDRLLPQAAAVIARARQIFPEARLLAFPYFIVDGSERRLEQHLPASRAFTPVEALRTAAEVGNWCGAPVGVLVHRDGVKDGFDFGSLGWVADWQFCLGVIGRVPSAYFAEPIGEFHLAARRYHRAEGSTLWALLEYALLRKQAADRYLALGGDAQTHQALLTRITRETEAAVARRCRATGGDVANLLGPLAASDLLAGLGHKVRRRLGLGPREGR
jgi:hypothetical protein